MQSTTTELQRVLRVHGFRATTVRIALLKLLQSTGHPMSVAKIQAMWPGTTPEHTTLYRALSDLAVAGIIRRSDLNSGVAHFEYTPDRPHHHHIVCIACGRIEELEHCIGHKLESRALAETASFATINDHVLEFFGTCRRCVHA